MRVGVVKNADYQDQNTTPQPDIIPVRCWYDLVFRTALNCSYWYRSGIIIQKAKLVLYRRSIWRCIGGSNWPL